MHGDDRFAIAEIAIDHARHELVALRIEPPLGAGLRNATRELAPAQILIRRDRESSPDR